MSSGVFEDDYILLYPITRYKDNKLLNWMKDGFTLGTSLNNVLYER